MAAGALRLLPPILCFAFFKQAIYESSPNNTYHPHKKEQNYNENDTHPKKNPTFLLRFIQLFFLRDFSAYQCVAFCTFVHFYLHILPLLQKKPPHMSIRPRPSHHPTSHHITRVKISSQITPHMQS